MESFVLEYWPCVILKLDGDRNIDFDLEENCYFWKSCCFLIRSCIIADPQTVVTETEAETGALQRCEPVEISAGEDISTELRVLRRPKQWLW